MLFNSFGYWFFFAAVILLTAFSGQKWKRAIVVVASYVFYACWDPRLCLLLFGSTLANFWFGIAIDDAPEQRRKLLVTLAVIFNLVTLAFFKYLDFFADSLTALLGMHGHPWALGILLPVGISFFTFESVAYCCDIYRRDMKATRSLTDFALFISFFPHLVAGPIIRPENFFPQLRDSSGLSLIDIKWGFCQILKGLLKKIIFADFFALTANAYFNHPADEAVAPLVGVIAFAMQIYFDFSGYTDIARGCAALLGIRLPSNFERPYLSANIADFWRRWHISLSSWLRDYLYIPLGGNRSGPVRVYLNLMIVMALGGLWHGASWNFMAWGAAHGAMLCIHRVWTRTAVGRIKLPPSCQFATTAVATAGTFAFVTIAWVPFRAADFSTTATIFKQLFSARVFDLAGVTPMYAVLLLVSIAWCAWDSGRRVQRWLVETMPFRMCAIPVALALIALQLFGQFDLQIPFIYFKF